MFLRKKKDKYWNDHHSLATLLDGLGLRSDLVKDIFFTKTFCTWLHLAPMWVETSCSRVPGPAGPTRQPVVMCEGLLSPTTAQRCETESEGRKEGGQRMTFISNDGTCLLGWNQQHSSTAQLALVPVCTPLGYAF